MQTKHLCVLIYYISNDEVGTVKLYSEKQLKDI